MKTRELLKKDNGFTLVEVVIALGVFAIGISSYMLLTTSAVRGNSSAYRISSATNWATDRVEQMLEMPYDAGNNGDDDDGDGSVDNTGEKFDDQNGDALAGLDDVDGNADYSLNSPDGNYTIFWNIAEDQPGSNMKTVRVIVRNQLLNSDLAFTNIKILNR